MDSRPHIFIGDIGRCPFIPGDTGYDTWMRRDNERLEELSKYRKELRLTAGSYMSHEDRNVRNMAIFIDNFLSDK